MNYILGKLKEKYDKLTVRKYPFANVSNKIRIKLFPKSYFLLNSASQKYLHTCMNDLIINCKEVVYVQNNDPLEYFVEVDKSNEDKALMYLESFNPEVVEFAKTGDRYVEDSVNDALIEIDSNNNSVYYRIFTINNLASVNRFKLFYDLRIAGTSIYYQFNKINKSVISNRLSGQSIFNIRLNTNGISPVKEVESELSGQKIYSNATEVANGTDAVDLDIRIKLRANTLEELNIKHKQIIQYFECESIKIESCFMNELGAYAVLDPRNINPVIKYNTSIDIFIDDAIGIMPFLYHVSSSSTGIKIGKADNEDYYLDDKATVTPHLLIAGSSGSGKTHFAKNLIKKYYEQGDHVLVIDGKLTKSENGFVWDFADLKNACPNIDYYAYDMQLLFNPDKKAIIEDEIYNQILDSETKYKNTFNSKRLVIVIDECHIYKDCTKIINLIDFITRTGRSQNIMLLAISQQMSDFEATAAKSLISLCDRKIFLRQNEEEARYLRLAGYLSEEQSEFVQNARVGQAIIKIQNYQNKENHVKRVQLFKEF